MKEQVLIVQELRHKHKLNNLLAISNLPRSVPVQTNFTSINELKTTIDGYIHYYNYDRIKTKLKGLSPVRYRNLVLGQTT
ncbi:hypothetical protein AAX10_09980 [Moraxella bovoculi]|nr:hypothetical protein AAX10_09980 [Moraxella bovoculi]